MPVSTLDFGAFLSDMHFAKGAAFEKEGKLGKVKDLFPLLEQELPEVPAASYHFTFNSGLAPYTGPWGPTQAAHLLRRTGFGVRKTEMNLLAAMGMQNAVNAVLTPATAAPPPPVNNYNNPDYTDPVVPAGQPWVNAPYNVEAEGYRIQSWRAWWYDLMTQQGANVQERMTLFWHNHFATQTETIFWGRAAYDHNQLLRAHALGNFKTLTKMVTLDGMMLLYLNGFLNTKGAPDENYARELQELFTIGKDNPDHYTEDDVVQAARVLTGWKVNFDTNTSYHFPIDHDFGNKQFSAFYNNTVIQGSVNGEEELDAMLDMIFAKNEVAEFICRKIYRWFVYYKIDANTEANVIQPLAEIFRNNNYEIAPVLDALFKSEHFYEAAQSGCYVKTPLDIVLGTLRTMNTEVPGTTPWDRFVLQYYLTFFMAESKMTLGDPPNVAGWQAYRQIPQYYRIWVNSDTLRVRNTFTDVMTAFYLETDNDRLRFDLLAFVAQLDNPGDPNALVNETTRLFLPQDLSATKKFLLKSILLSGLPQDFYWTAAWSEYISDPGNPVAVEVVQTRLTAYFLYLFRLPEFQLC